jgi:hypothetical protein
MMAGGQKRKETDTTSLVPVFDTLLGSLDEAAKAFILGGYKPERRRTAPIKIVDSSWTSVSCRIESSVTFRTSPCR